MTIAVQQANRFPGMPKPSPSRWITTLSWLFVAVASIIAGAGLILWAALDFRNLHPVRNSIANNIGGVLLATGLISVLWELFSKRAFLSEVFSVAKLSEDIKTTGLMSLTTNFQHNVEWPTLLQGARRLDVFLSYGRTWRNTNLPLLRAFAERSGSQMNLILPDPECAEVLGELARRYGTSPETIKDRVQEAINEFKAMFDRKRSGRGQLAIWVTTKTPVLSFYRIDNKYVLATYRHRPDRGDIPTLLCDRKGELTTFIDMEIEFLTDDSNSCVRKIFPPPKATGPTESASPPPPDPGQSL